MLEFKKDDSTIHKINRPKFEFKHRGRRRGTTPKHEGGPSLAMKLTCESEPLDFFNLMIADEFRLNAMLKCTNQRAAVEGAGGSIYADWRPLSIDEINAFLGLLIANGICPKPNIGLWFANDNESKIFGNNNFKQRFRGGERRWRVFRRFFAMHDARLHPAMPQCKKPLFKVERLLNHINDQSMKHWETGINLSIDEMTIGFQGRHKDKLRITYKKIGDGFQADSTCDEGHCYQFRFRHDDQPENEAKCGLHKRVTWLADKLKNNWSRVHMDNLYISLSLAKLAYSHKFLIHGVARTYLRGVPKVVLQQEQKNKTLQNAVRGLVKVAVLKEDEGIPDLVACSLYDTKPVHFLSSCVEEVVWMTKSRKVWDKNNHANKNIDFLRLNVVNEYNFGMGGVDIADQLRLQHRVDRWMRQSKWWWSIWLWSLSLAATNGYIIWRHVYDKEIKLKRSTPTYYSHVQFLEKLALQLIWPEVYYDTARGEVLTQVSATTTSTRTTNRNVTGGTETRNSTVDKTRLLNRRVQTLTERTLTTCFPKRLDGKFHPSLPTYSKPCQYCQYKERLSNPEAGKKIPGARRHRTDGGKLVQPIKRCKRTYDNVSRCIVCNVELCPECFLNFHGIDLNSY